MNQPNEGMREYTFPPNNNSPETLSLSGGILNYLDAWKNRFDEEFGDLKAWDRNGDNYYPKAEIKDFIDSEIDLALAKQRSQIVEIINSLEDSIEKNLYGYDCFPGSPQQAKDTISIIISTINKQQHDK